MYSSRVNIFMTDIAKCKSLASRTRTHTHTYIYVKYKLIKYFVKTFGFCSKSIIWLSKLVFLCETLRMKKNRFPRNTSSGIAQSRISFIQFLTILTMYVTKEA